MTLDTTAEDVREQVRLLLEGKDVFRDIPALSHKSHDLAAMLAEIQTKVGARLVVVLLSAKELGSQSNRTDWRIDFAVDCGEYVPLNQTASGTGKGAWALAFTVTSALKLAPLVVNDEEIFPEAHPDLEVRELIGSEKWDANLLIVRAPFRLAVSGIPRPTTD